MWKGLILLALVVGAAGYWWMSRDSEALQAAAAAKVTRAEQEVGIRQMLAGHDTFKFSNVVLTLEGPDGQPEFRGQIESQEAVVAAYGQVQGNCDSEYTRSECWSLALLEADGRPVELSTAPEVPSEEPQQAATGSAEGTAPAQTAASDGNAPAPTPTPTAAPAADAPAAQPSLAGPTATHVVTRPRINSRAGPGTGNPIITQLVGDTRLGLLTSQGGWGQFVVIDGPSEGETVWIALSLTAPI